MLKRNIKVQGAKKKKGQSTVEYIILVSCVLGALIYFLGGNGPFQTAFNQTLNSGTGGMENMARRLGGSRYGS